MASNFPSAAKRYVIKEVLGKGGMGLVYRAYDNETRRHVTLKTLLNVEDPSALELFRKECEVLSRMNHPNIVDVYDIGELDDAEGKKPYFVMPLLVGSTLDRLIASASERLTVERTVDIVTQACRGLQAAHERGLVHRDVKPSNIFVLEDDSVKIIDFGVAHLSAKNTLTSVKGTLHYMAPEQLQMQKPTPASDLFSLGVVCYEALTRKKPFDGATAEEVVQAILHQIPPPASDLNPVVNRALSQVIHKALAKQAFHRFASAREFAELLQRGLRGEAIELFDESRALARVDRARRALDAGELEFAGEVLGGLEAEGYIHPDMAHLREQINRAQRERAIRKLLENATRCFQEEEYQLALQKIQEVLRIDPQHTDAVTLKAEIENKRSSEQINKWLALAQQHLENHAYGHARQALEDVLHLKPDDTQARKMLALVKAREQDYVRTRKEKEDLYQSALEAWRKGEVSSALSELERVLQLDRRAPDTTNPERATSYQNAYNQVRSDHDALKSAYEEARRQLNQHNFKAALRICEEMLAKYPGHALFQALKVDVEEAQRQDLSAFIARIDREVETEPDLERRVSILREALAARPGESHFERSLQLTISKRELVNSIVGKARTYEERRQFQEALNQWETLRTIYASYPGLDFEVERVTRRRDQQARTEAKASWVEKIDHCLAGLEWQRALDLTQNALVEFPDDAELKALEQLARQGLSRACEAQRLLEEGKALCAAQRLEEGIGTLRRAYQLDERDGRVRTALLDATLKHARALLESDPEGAYSLIGAALELDPSHALAKSLRTLLDDRKRSQIVDACLARARGLQVDGDLEHATEAVQEGLAEFPHEPRLLQLKASLERVQTEQRRMAVRRSDLEQLRGLELRSQQTADSGELRAMLEQTVHVANRHSGDRDFEDIVGFLRSRLAAVSQSAAGIEKAAAVKPQAIPPAPPDSSVSSQPAGPAPAPEEHVAEPAQTPPRPAEAALPPPRLGPRKMSPRLVAAATCSALVVLAAMYSVYWVLQRRNPREQPVLVKITSEPPGAVVMVDGTIVAVTPASISLRPGKRGVKFLLDGYQTIQREWNVVPAFAPPATERLEALPARLYFTCDTPDAKVTVDGEARTPPAPGAPLELTGLSLNAEHKFQISSPAGSAEFVFKAAPGGLPEVTFSPGAKSPPLFLLSRLGSRGRFAAPTKVKVSVDGGKAFQDAGPEGLSLDQISEAGLLVDNGSGERKTLAVDNNTAPTIHAYAYLSKITNYGGLRIESAEPDFVVLVNGKKAQCVMRGQVCWVYNVPAGIAKVEFIKEGFRAEPESASADVKPNTTPLVKIGWTALPTMLLIHGALPATQVKVAGKIIATADANGDAQAEVAPGDLNFFLSKPGYRTVPLIRRVRRGTQLTIGLPESKLEMATGVLVFRPLRPTRGISLVVQQTKGIVQYSGPKKFAEVPSQLVLPEGAYNLHFGADGFREQSMSADLADEQPKVIPIRLDPGP